MKKRLWIAGIIGVLVISVFVSPASAQGDKETLQKKEAQAAVPADSDRYIIGAEDELYIHVWKEEALSRAVPVRMDGKISLPLIDEIQAAGLTPLQLKEQLVKRLKEFVDNPTVSVIVNASNSYRVFVSGEVNKKGVYNLRSETTILQLISMTGGFTEWANPKKILIIRKENGKEKRFTVNYKKIVNGEDIDSNIVLKSGDTILVP